jgi:hypothetical protein
MSIASLTLAKAGTVPIRATSLQVLAVWSLVLPSLLLNGIVI